jgi:tetratricopeptide (TPR) repeat protein
MDFLPLHQQLTLFYHLAQQSTGRQACAYYAAACQLLENHPQRQQYTRELVDAYRYLAEAYLAQGDLIQAQTNYDLCIRQQRTLSQHPNLANDLDRLAEIYEMRGQTWMAQRLRQRAHQTRRLACDQ